MNLVITLTCKFRAFFITFGTIGPVRFKFPVPAVAVIFAEEIREKLKFNERGVKLEATLERLP